MVFELSKPLYLATSRVIVVFTINRCYSNLHNNNNLRIQGIFIFTCVASKHKKKMSHPLTNLGL